MYKSILLNWSFKKQCLFVLFKIVLRLLLVVGIALTAVIFVPYSLMRLYVNAFLTFIEKSVKYREYQCRFQRLLIGEKALEEAEKRRYA